MIGKSDSTSLALATIAILGQAAPSDHCKNPAVERPPGRDSHRGTALLQVKAGLTIGEFQKPVVIRWMEH